VANLLTDSEEAPVFRTILIGIDGSQRSGRILELGAELALTQGASIHVLCAIDPAYFLQEPDRGRPSTGDELDYPAAAIEREGTDRIVREAVSKLRAQGLIASGEVLPGSPAETIALAAAQLNSDLIVLGHRHLSWLRRQAEGSVAQQVLERTPIPVMVVP